MRALVTGASSGIGEEFAVRLAEEGWDLVLVARRGDLLDALAERLRGAYGVEVGVLVCDLSKPESARRVTDFVPEVDFLISNAGFGYPGDFGSVDESDDVGLVQLNCVSPMQLAHFYMLGCVWLGLGRFYLFHLAWVFRGCLIWHSIQRLRGICLIWVSLFTGKVIPTHKTIWQYL